MNKEIKYVGFYDTYENSQENREYTLSATNKMDYISATLNKLGYKILIVSPSWTKNKQFHKGKIIKLYDDISLKLFSTLPWGNKIQKALSLIYGDLLLFFYLITKVNRNETILVYHSLWLRSIVRFAKKIKKFKVILEVEEIYQDVVSCSKYTRKEEYKNFVSANGYILSTTLLINKLNIANKPYIIVNGTYQVVDDQKCKFNDGMIHVVYAGTFDSRKGGGVAAVAAAEYLPKNYHLHIIGFGSKEDTNDLLIKIQEISKKSEAIITYDGLLSGEDYIRFLQKCDIGLSTQIPSAGYNDTSFPSKILSYMSNGLRVVTVRIKAVELSTIGNAVYYYEEQTPESIAKTIMSINIDEYYDSRALIKKLDVQFTESMKKLLENKNA